MNLLLVILITIFTLIYYYIKFPKKETMFPLENLKKLILPKKLEISDLERTRPELFFRYGDSTNYFYNDGRTIYQECIKLLNNRVIINGYRYGLSKIIFSKSVLKWKNQKVGLELRLLHQSTESQDLKLFIIPLNLIDQRKESFTELNKFKKEKREVKLNTIVNNSSQIPSYLCCTANKGPLVEVNLCPVANILLKQEYFYKYEMNDKITYFITKPQDFDRLLGLNIRQKLSG